MPSPARFLQSSSHFPVAEPPITVTMDSDVVVILASLLCALICVVGLALVARCAWIRRSSASSSDPPPPPLPNKGIKKKALRSLPTLSFNGAVGGKLADCAICLAEFEDGDEIRILPQCGHGFHVGCIDMWLGSHSSCPSCRQILVVPASSRCQRCGASSDAAATADGDDNGFLP